jgi:hypothetical protein
MDIDKIQQEIMVSESLAAMHLNSTPPGFPQDHRHQAKVAGINLDAAKYCWEVSAFNEVEMMLKNGLDDLNLAKQWSEEHCMSPFELIEIIARTQLIILGNFGAFKDTTREALRHAGTMTAEMKTKLLLVEVEVRTMVGNEVNNAISVSWHQDATKGKAPTHFGEACKGESDAEAKNRWAYSQSTIHRRSSDIKCNETSHARLHLLSDERRGRYGYFLGPFCDRVDAQRTWAVTA